MSDHRSNQNSNLPQRLGFPLALIILLGMPLALLVIYPQPGLQDYPNHLARAFILLHPDDPLISKHYEVAWAPVPNLGWDLWAVGVGRVLSLEATGRLFVAIATLLTLAGCFALNRAIVGRWTWAPILMFPFLFNAGFTKGFLSFNLGIGLALLAIAWWISHDQTRPHRMLIASLLSVLLYLVHLYAFAIYGLFIAGWAIDRAIRAGGRSERWKRLCGDLLAAAIQTVPVILLIAIAWLRLSGQSSGTTRGLREFELPFSRVSDLDLLIDVGSPMANDALIVASTATIAAALLTRIVRLRPGAAVPIVLCVAAFFLLPGSLEGTHFVSWRVIFAGLLFLISSIEPTKASQAAVPHWLLVPVVVVTAVTIVLQGRSWSRSAQGYREFSQLVATIPEGSKLFVAHSGVGEKQLRAREVGLYHVASYAVIERRALVQSMFTFTGQQPLRYRDAGLQHAPEHSGTFLDDIVSEFNKAGVDFASYSAQFDYLIMHGEDDGPEKSVLPMDRVRLVDRIGVFRLYQVVRPYAEPAQTVGR